MTGASITGCVRVPGGRSRLAEEEPVDERVAHARPSPGRWIRALGWLRNNTNWLLPGSVAAMVPVFGTGALVGAAADRRIAMLTSGLMFTVLLVYMFGRLARLPGLAKATARFWATTAWAVGGYAAGMAVDLAAALSHAALGTPNTRFG